MYILDTNVVSELRKIPFGRCDENVSSWASDIDFSTTYLSVISVLEIELGIQQIHRRDKKQSSTLKKWFEELLVVYEHRVLSFDSTVALKTASLHVPDPMPDRDAVIAGTALVHGFIVVTRNLSDFSSTNDQLQNPWKSD